MTSACRDAQRRALRRRHDHGPAEGRRRHATTSLEPDELWRYTCTHKVTASDPDPLPNTVARHRQGPDRRPGAPSRTRTRPSVDLIQPAPPQASRKPAPQQQVLAAQQQADAARPCPPAGPSGCVYRRSARPSAAARSAASRSSWTAAASPSARPATASGPSRPGSARPPQPRSAPGHRPRRVPNRIPDPRAHAGAELPALRAAGPVTPVHRLMRVWLPALALVATALAVPATASADVRLSTERSVTRWAHANLLAKVRKAPTAQLAHDRAPALEDRGRAARGLRGPPQPARAAARRGCRSASRGGRTAAPAGSAATRSAACTRSTPR